MAVRSLLLLESCACTCFFPRSFSLFTFALMNPIRTYDPHVIKEWVGPAADHQPALEGFYGLKEDQWDTPAAREMRTKAAPITCLTKDDPPVWAYYSDPRDPVPANAKPGSGIHHITFGLKPREQKDNLGIECTILRKDDRRSPTQGTVDFFVKHLITAK